MKPAERILRIFDSLMAQSMTDDQAFRIWAKVFDIDGPIEHLEDEVVPCVQALRGEIKATKDLLLARGVIVDMLDPAFARLAQYASPGNLHQKWSSFRGNLVQPEIRLAFQWAAWAAPDAQEDALSPELIDDLSRAIDDLETAAHAVGVSPFIRELIMKAVTSLRAGLRLYGVQGLRALGDALQETTGAVVASQGHAAAEVADGGPETKTAMARLQATLNAVVKSAEGVDKVNKGIEAGKSVYRHLEQAWNTWGPLLTGPGSGTGSP